MIIIETISPEDARAESLIAALDELQLSLYAEESNHLDSASELLKPNVHFLGALSQEELLGCGAVKLLTDNGDGRTYGEVKRMFVSPAARGQGVAKMLMNALEERAKADGATLMRLETGIHQPEAIGLYERFEFRRCGPFGAYGPDPVSVFMEKAI